MTEVHRIDRSTLPAAVRALVDRDADLARVVARHGPPPLWPREPGFETIVRIILEQQVSLASGHAAYDRLTVAIPAVTPAVLADSEPVALERAGLTRQKARYLIGLGRAVVEGRLDLASVADADDATARDALCAVPGIGAWTADVYLLMALGRPDVWPAGDVALATAMAAVKGLAERPGPSEMHRLAGPWRPLRAVAARILWHAYLQERATRADRDRRSG